MKKRITWLLTILFILTLAACGGTADEAGGGLTEGGPIPDYEDNVLGSGRGWYGDLPKGLRPMVMVGGKLYRWTGLSKEFCFRGEEVYTVGDSSTVLPEGYTVAGELSGITEAVPSEELQLRAGFDATGTVFVSAETPEVVYALMTTDWFENFYIRFVSDELRDNECISYQGRAYRISIGTDICEKVEALPEGCVLAGTLQYIGSDAIPVGDLETNCISDSYSKTLHGREVYTDPADPGVLYVYEHQYWAQGDYPAWRACRLWSEHTE